MSNKCFQEKHRCLVLSMNQSRQNIYFYKAPSIGQTNRHEEAVSETPVPEMKHRRVKTLSSSDDTDTPELLSETKCTSEISECETPDVDP